MNENHDTNTIVGKTGFVFFNSQPAGFEIFVNGSFLVDPITNKHIITPAKVELPTGNIDFIYRLYGYDDIIGNVVVKKDAIVDIHKVTDTYIGKTIPFLLEQLVKLNNRIVELLEAQAKK